MCRYLHQLPGRAVSWHAIASVVRRSEDVRTEMKGRNRRRGPPRSSGKAAQPTNPFNPSAHGCQGEGRKYSFLAGNRWLEHLGPLPVIDASMGPQAGRPQFAPPRHRVEGRILQCPDEPARSASLSAIRFRFPRVRRYCPAGPHRQGRSMRSCQLARNSRGAIGSHPGNRGCR